MCIELQLQMELYDWFEVMLHQHQLSPATAQRYFWGEIFVLQQHLVTRSHQPGASTFAPQACSDISAMHGLSCPVASVNNSDEHFTLSWHLCCQNYCE